LSKLIVFEGIDGSGKTTLAYHLRDELGENAFFLSKKSIEAGTEFQRQFMSEIKPILWERKPNEPISEIDEESWLYLHMLWYHMLQNFVIINKLEEYEYVIMDGWYYKFLARHFVNKKMETSTAKYLVNRLLQPDKIFLLNAPPEICFNRKGIIKASECGAHEKGTKTEWAINDFCEYQKKVYDAYLEILNGSSMSIIDASQAIDSILDEIIKKVRSE
jgi:thymidylate kinase